MEKTKKIIIGIGAFYCLYALVLFVSLVGAVVYDSVNGGHEAFHWVYQMQSPLADM